MDTRQFKKMLDEYEDLDMAACSDAWDSAAEYHVFSTTKKVK